ncbi:MAG TPA: FAD-dependent thymidylate synthase [Terriglobales bacterium]|nr:FAD-dependent thymidylate synthase [Terriglobales bacterium]
MSEKAVLQSENPAPTSEGNPRSSQTETEVFAVYGAEPEVQAYAMAKYSRSALSMKESLKELNEQKAEKFLNTFYFQYGHRSIADLAHVALAVERLSLLAAIALVDEQRWDGQERSTRYQNFQKSGYYVPDFDGNERAEELYRQTIDELFRQYQSLSETVFRFLTVRTAKPDDMKQEAYERTLRARAFDITRYLLPLATNTSLGQIVNARTLETQVSRLLSDPHAEIRNLGELLKRAASQPAWNLNYERYRDLVSKLREKDESLANEAGGLLLKDVRVAPTLVKYAEPSSYQNEARRELRAAAKEVMADEEIESADLVDLLDDEPLEIELATTLLYEHCHHPYRQIRRKVEVLGEKQRAEIIDIGIRLRGGHDELLRAYCSGQKFRFDILMDIGGFRDMHRHRRCIQIGQGFTTRHGFDTPEEVLAAGAGEQYAQAMENAADAAKHLQSVLRGHLEALENSEYLIPLAYRKRTLFKMDLAEAVYISELRSKPEGHISYRRVAYAMYEEVVKRYPALRGMFRVRDINEPVDLLKR